MSSGAQGSQSMSSGSPTIAVFGTLNRDTTTYADGTRSENLGGLVYTLATLAALGAGRLRILPVANVGVDLVAAARSALEPVGIDCTELRPVPVANNHVYLTYDDSQEREEILVGRVPPLSLEQCWQARGARAVIVNLTSGCDLELETLLAFRGRYRGSIHLDIHSLTLGIGEGGRRYLRVPERWRDWVSCADWLQLNECEARLLGGGAAVEEFAAAALGLASHGVLVTLGARGCFAAWREPQGTMRREFAAPHLPAPAFPTGCGDVFGATFAYARLRGVGIPAALELANQVASLKAGFEPQAALGELRRWAAEPLARVLTAESGG